MNKTILITAGAKRLGKVFAEEMIKKNWSIALHYNKNKSAYASYTLIRSIENKYTVKSHETNLVLLKYE